MVELIAAVALAPWAQPLRFRPLPGWQSGASGTLDSSYGPVPDNASPNESTAWMARGVRYRDQPTADPPHATLARLPRQGIVVFVVVYQSARTTERRIDLRLDRARRYACCDGTYVAGGAYGLSGAGTGGRIFGDRACLLRLASNRGRCARRHSAHSIISNCPRHDKRQERDARLRERSGNAP